MRKGVSYIIPLILLSQLVLGQQKISDRLKQVTDAYTNAINFSANVNVLQFKDKEQKVGTRMGIGIMKKVKDGYYSKFIDDEMIANDKCTIIISHDEKRIVYMEPINLSGKISSFIKMPSLDSLLKKNDSVVYQGITNGNEHYVFYNKKSVIIRTDIYVDHISHFMKKLVYYYAPSTKDNNIGLYKLEISYNDISLNPADKSCFSESKYITYLNGKPVLQNAFKNYKLVIAEKYKNHPSK